MTNRELRDITDEALAALVARNVPPTLFQRGGTLVRLRETDASTPLLERMGEHEVRGALARAANWRRMTRDGPAPVSPPVDVVHDILALPQWPDLPALDMVIEAPVFTREGTILATPGYHADARLYLYPPPSLVIPGVPENPSREAVLAARDLILGELFADFPFEDDASRAHAFAALLLPFVRHMIEGPTPLHVIDAPTPGTGKGLLADVIALPATGRGAEVMAEGQNDEEWRKRITAILEKAPAIILIDNVRRRLDSAALAAALTGGVWTDRILGKSTMITLPVRGLWLATGNNIGLSTELVRRAAYIRLDPRTDAPWTRTGFRHVDLRSWARANRGRVVHACLSLIQAWIVAGRPRGDTSLGSFESWSATLGGILTVAEVPGFLGNTGSLFAQVEDETREWRPFILAWWDAHRDKTVGVETLYQLADEDTLLSEVLGEGWEHARRTRLGRALGRMRDRIIAGFRIARTGEDHRGRQLYRLERAEGTQGSPTSPSHVATDVGTQTLNDDLDF